MLISGSIVRLKGKIIRDKFLLENYLQKHPEELSQYNNFNLNKLSWIYVSLPIILTFSLIAYAETERKRKHLMLMREKKDYSITALRNYVLTNLKKGYTKQQIRNALMKYNYGHEQIDEALGK